MASPIGFRDWFTIAYRSRASSWRGIFCRNRFVDVVYECGSPERVKLRGLDFHHYIRSTFAKILVSLRGFEAARVRHIE
jgi:hypothetical protein